MQQSLEVMKSALRVLLALNQKKHPPQPDIDQLIKFAGPIPSGTDLDRFACDAIEAAVKHRTEMRDGKSFTA